MKSPDLESGDQKATETTPLLRKITQFQEDCQREREAISSQLVAKHGPPPKRSKSVMDKLGEGASMMLPGTLIGDIVHKYNYKQSYGEHIELSVRAGLAAAAFGIVLLHPAPHSMPWGDKGNDLMKDVISSLALVMFFWTIAKTLGATLYNMWYNVIGQGIASIFIWVMYGFMPGGRYKEWNDEAYNRAWWVGVVGGTSFVVLNLYLNFDTNTKILSLNNFTYFWMLYMDGVKNKNSQGFTFDFHGSLWLMLVQCGVGGICALLVALVPYPVLAKDKMRQTAKAITEDICSLWEEISQTYWIADIAGAGPDGDVAIYEFDKLVHDVRNLETALINMEATIAESWWECFGLGGLERSRQCLTYCRDAIHKDLDHLPQVLRACESSRKQNAKDGGDAHRQVADQLLPKILKLLQSVAACLRKCTMASINCGPDADDREQIAFFRDRVRQSIDEVCDAVCEKRPNTGTEERILDLDSCDEYTYLFCLSHFGRSTMHLADQLVKFHELPKHSSMYVIANNFVPYGLFDASVLKDVDHIKFVIRNAAGILLAFMIGFQGFPNKMFSDGQLLPPHSYGPSAVLTLMVTKFLGSAVTRTLGRITGVILGVVIGMICVGMLVNDWEHRVIGLALFTGGSVFMFHNLELNGSTFVLLGVYGAKVFIMQCPGGCTFAERKQYCMGQILDCMFALFCMVIIDFVMMARPASAQASDQLELCWDEMCKSADLLFDGNEPKTKYNDGTLRAKIETARTLGLEGAQEPRYWRTPFQGFLFNKVVNRFLAIRFALQACHYSAAKGGKNGGDKNPIFCELCEMDAWKEIGQLINERMALIRRLLPLFGWVKVWRFDELDNKDMITGGYKKKVKENLKQLVADINDVKDGHLHLASDEGGDHDDNTLEKDPISKLSILFLCINEALSDMQKMQHDIMRNA